ncbi:MAG TPA: TIGR03862 family flavoprotein [Steroidobacteraceae bacterium]|nr:TIGR03862 family flavoprotein [Steroidobacteraceae bacterium]
MNTAPENTLRVAVIGGGPAGLMAAETLAQAGVSVDVYDAMRSVGRKFLLAGRGGLNLTHSENANAFYARYGARRAQLAPMLDAFGAEALRQWTHDLGIETFVGTSGRVFPREMKAAPLLRAWLQRLRNAGVRFHMRHRWIGWTADGTGLRFDTPEGERLAPADAVVLALGGGSWAKLGSDGGWVPLLAQHDVTIAPLKPSNCGFDVQWSEHFRNRFAGQPVKSIMLHFTDRQGRSTTRRGEFLVTDSGVEGSAIYALSALLRDEIAQNGSAVLHVDLAPDKTAQRLAQEIAHPRGSRSMSSHLKSRVGIEGVKAGLLRECVPAETYNDATELAAAIKALPIRLVATRALDEAISSAGGVTFDAMNEQLMLRKLPGVFCAGEMLDWEAPTGGYLLTACFASGKAAAHGVLHWLRAR